MSAPWHPGARQPGPGTPLLRLPRRPRALRVGDRVAVVAPSGPLDPRRLERGVAWLSSLGLRVEVGLHARGRDATTPYLAGTDAQRCADLQQAWCDPGVAAVVCARGGYGAARLLPLLDLEAMAARGADPPWLVGSSDVTSLHTALRDRLGVATLFGPMAAAEVLAGEVPDETSREHLRATLFGASPRLPAGTVMVPGSARGRLVGGTLALLAAAVGTPWAGSARDAVVILEDVGEAAYALDRAVSQLLASGWFDDVRAVVLGTWEGCAATAAQTVARRLAVLDVPVLAGLLVGHGAPQLSVVLGSEMEVEGAQLRPVGTLG